MKPQEQTEREIAQIILAAAADEGTPEDLEKLNQLILNRPQLAAFVVDLMSQESWLNWYTARSRNGSIRSEMLEHIAHVVQASIGTEESTDPHLIASCANAVPLPGRSFSRERFSLRNFVANGSRLAATLAALLLVAIGVVLGLTVANWRQASLPGFENIRIAESELGTPDSSYVARFVHGTACLWNQEINAALTSDDALRTGESLSLLEGLAELQLDWDNGGAALKIEGPAGLVLTADRGASLSHGRFTADIEASGSQFNLSTPNGLIEVSGTTSLGVDVSRGNVELHLFKGSAQFVGPWTRGVNRVEPVEVSAGDAIRIVSDAEGRVRIDRDIASPSSFASKVSMGSDHLLVSPEYVREIIAAEPLVYWRFEDNKPDEVANEMGDNYLGRLTGMADRVKQAGNTSLELGAGLTEHALQSYIFCDEPLNDDFSHGYTVETWFKPSHYHWGSVIAFLGDPAQPGWRAPHGLLLEIGGPRSSDSEIEHPGRVRYLHRNPPGGDFNSGTSCFSAGVYELRKWQHIVAIKSESKMRLYVNGELVAEGEDPSTLAPGMKVIIGQLDREQFYRKFIGQIDEFAVYARPLTEQEVIQHYKLIRPGWNKIGLPKPSKRTAFQSRRPPVETGVDA